MLREYSPCHNMLLILTVRLAHLMFIAYYELA